MSTSNGQQSLASLSLDRDPGQASRECRLVFPPGPNFPSTASYSINKTDYYLYAHLIAVSLFLSPLN